MRGATFDHQVHFSARRSCSVLFIGVAILIIVAWQAAIPIRHAVANRYIERGDSYVALLNFEEAQEEYESALHYDSSSAKAQERKALITEASTDIAQARSLFEELGQTTMVEKIDNATQNYEKPKEALQAGVTLYESSQFNLARYPLEKAVMLDPEYPEAWHYLSLVYDKLAEFNVNFRAKAEEARAKRDALSPQWIQ